MKVLYITNHQTIYDQAGYINDYLNDLMFHGLHELYKEGIITELVDSTPILHLYKENKPHFPLKVLWGRGMTSAWLIEEPMKSIDRSNIEDKIKNKYYDLIIYGAIRRCTDYYNLVEQTYDHNKVICLDGNDDTECLPEFYSKFKYFKRELTQEHSNIYPITFGIPSSKLCVSTCKKTQEYGTVIPGDSKTYIYHNENHYYEDYQKSYYGVTMKKAGWDCMRHHEIVANRCMPYFIDIEQCPEKCLYNFPKDLLIEAKQMCEDFKSESEYDVLMNKIYEYWEKNLTTKQIAKYIIKCI
jgi:hypothetical protein